LPRETQAYVLIVTGHAAQEWTKAADRMSLNLPDGVPCPQIVKLFVHDQLETPRTAVGGDNAKSVNGSTTAEAPWGVQLIGGSSQISVLASYHQLQRKYQTVLGSREPLVIRSQVGRNASWYRLRIAAQILAEAFRAPNVAADSVELGGPATMLLWFAVWSAELSLSLRLVPILGSSHTKLPEVAK
jgi:hypothetical protein